MVSVAIGFVIKPLIRRIEFLNAPPSLFPINSVAICEEGKTLLMAAHDGQAYFAKFTKRSNEVKQKIDLDYMERRAKEDAFSVSGYIKKDIELGQTQEPVFSLI